MHFCFLFLSRIFLTSTIHEVLPSHLRLALLIAFQRALREDRLLNFCSKDNTLQWGGG
jgi:hypothetical protein